MPDLQGWSDLSTGEGSSQEARGFGQGGEGAEGGSTGPVDGQPQGSRVGEAGEMPHDDLNWQRFGIV